MPCAVACAFVSPIAARAALHVHSLVSHSWCGCDSARACVACTRLQSLPACSHCLPAVTAALCRQAWCFEQRSAVTAVACARAAPVCQGTCLHMRACKSCVLSLRALFARGCLGARACVCGWRLLVLHMSHMSHAECLVCSAATHLCGACVRACFCKRTEWPGPSRGLGDSL